MSNCKETMKDGATQSGSLFFGAAARLTDARVAKTYARLAFEAAEPLDIQPGRFLLLRDGDASMLPRAFSVLRSTGEGFELLIRLDGKMRERLACLPVGTALNVRGPYGTAYLDKISANRQYLLVGGGSGVAPLLHFAEQHPELVAGGVFGFQEASIGPLLPGVEVVTEDGDGIRADQRARDLWKPGLGILACGPEGLLRSIASDFGQEPDVYVSLEERLGCGIGTCLGCAISTTAGTRRICVEGPLFATKELPWLK